MTAADDPSREGLERALSYDPNNPSYHYRLGLYWHYDPGERDLNEALGYYINAIRLSPTNAYYWLELAKVYEDTGDLTGSRRALERAVVLNPTEKKTRWMMANLHLRQGEPDLALEKIGSIIKDHPRERTKAFSLIYSITGSDVSRTLRLALGEGAKVRSEYLSFLMGRKDTDAVKALWRSAGEGFDPDPNVRVKYIDYLVKSGEIREAWEEWSEYKGPRNDESNLVWNGSFEEEPAGWGFGWKVGSVDGAQIVVDAGNSAYGKRSLKIEFDGSRNINFHHLRQVVPLEEGAGYTLAVNMKADDITTTNGVFMEVYGINGCSFNGKTEGLTGASGWREYIMEFSTPPGCGAGVVRVRRAKSTKLNNKIGGSVWIDDVSLERAAGNVH